MPAISITPRRINHIQQRNYSGRFYYSSQSNSHYRAPLLRPLYGPKISRKPLQKKSFSISPGSTAYLIDKKITRRSQPGITQKPIQSCTTNPPFYYPKKLDHHRIPSFTMGQRLSSSKIFNTCAPPYYQSVDKHNLCSNHIKPGVTLKGRWSSLVYNI